MSLETEEWPPAPVDVAPEGRPVVRAVGLVAALVGIGAAVAFGVLAVSGSVFWSVFRAAMEHWAWDWHRSPSAIAAGVSGRAAPGRGTT